MKVINVPKFNNDGSIECTVVVGPEEARELLQFAINFLAGVGHHAYTTIPPQPEQLSLFPSPELND